VYSCCNYFCFVFDQVHVCQLRIGTRGSPLALYQARETKKLLGEAFEELKADEAVEIIVKKTTGDMILDKVRCCRMIHQSMSK
jgi:porphobilinogen deaminase